MSKRVAIVHEYLHQYGGGERVLEALHALYPEAPVYTLVYDRAALPQFAEWDIRVSVLNYIPWIRKRPQWVCVLFPLVWRMFSFSSYDVVIISTHAWATSVQVKKARTVAYCHTPVRYFWDLFDEYVRNCYLPLYVRIAMYALKWPVRWYDRWRAQLVDAFLVNSHEVRGRVKDAYDIDATVVYPPVKVKYFSSHARVQRNDYYLVVTRLKAYKRVDIIVDAFNALRKKLVIVGSGPEEQKLRALAGETIDFRSDVSDDELRDLYQRARGYVYMANEDFGMSLAEAQAAGTPVIAFRKGGACEIVTDGQSGVFVEEQTSAALCDAVRLAEERVWEVSSVQQDTARFSGEHFNRHIRHVVEG